MFLPLAGFLGGIVFTQLFPSKIPMVFTLMIGLLLFVFLNYKFEIALE
jgi:hypothetical protein